MFPDFARYRQILEALLVPRPFADGAEGSGAVQVERGAGMVTALREGNVQSIEAYFEPLLTAQAMVPPAVVVDCYGHRREVYAGLLAYCFIQSFGMMYERLPRASFGRWEEVGQKWSEGIEVRVQEVTWPGGGWPAARGGELARAVWEALTLAVAGKVLVRDSWTDQASEVFGKLARAQTPAGSLLTAGPGDNPETWWYHELVLLHAAASYAVQTEDKTVAAAVLRATRWHMAETQTDHATTQPWGVFAFLWNQETRAMGEEMIHAAQTLGTAGISQILLADALTCLRLFEK